MELNITYDAQSMLDQLPHKDRMLTQVAIDRVLHDLAKGMSPPSIMKRVADDTSNQVYEARAGNRWRVYFKLVQDELSVVDVVPAKQLDSLRRRPY